jgi:D-serine deaminase-like pyridoxal phosphate-dependent protein
LTWLGLVELPGLHFDGLTGCEGHCALTPERDLRLEKQRKAMAFFEAVAEAIAADGITAAVLSAGGPATWEWTAADPHTEIRAGTYVVMDKFHSEMVPGFEHSLTVQSTVIGRPPDRVIFDAGSKSIRRRRRVLEHRRDGVDGGALRRRARHLRSVRRLAAQGR